MNRCIRIVFAVAFASILAMPRAGAAPLPPEAGFMANLTNGVAPLTVDFTDFSTGAITNWFWDFGDDTTTNILFSPANLPHTYETPGIYSVELTVSGPGGASTDTQPDYITVIPEPSTLLFVGVGLCICFARLKSGLRKR